MKLYELDKKVCVKFSNGNWCCNVNTNNQIKTYYANSITSLLLQVKNA